MKNPKFQIYQDRSGEFRFRLRAGNGEVVLTSEGYSSKQSCQNGIDSVKKNAANEARYERKTTKSGETMFVLKAANAQVIGTSESYKSASGCSNGIKVIQKVAPEAPTEDLTAQHGA